MNEKQLSALLKQAVAEGVFPGAQFAVSLKGKLVFSEAAGLLGPGLGKNSPETIYDLASLTKPLSTAVLMAKAFQEERCRPEDKAQRYLSALPEEITLAHLLEHSSGLPAHVRFDKLLPAELSWGSWQAYQEIVRLAENTPLAQAVGHSAVYSDTGFILLGALLEKLFEKPLSESFAELSSELFFLDRRGAPAKLGSFEQELVAPTEFGLRAEVHDENCRAMGGVAGHAGLFGSAQEVVKFCQKLLRNYQGDTSDPLSPAAVKQMWQPSSLPGSSRTLGWDRPTPGGSTGGAWPEHCIGHLGFTGTSVWIDQEYGLIASLVSNRVCPTRDNNLIRTFRPQIHDAVWRCFGPS